MNIFKPTNRNHARFQAMFIALVSCFSATIMNGEEGAILSNDDWLAPAKSVENVIWSAPPSLQVVELEDSSWKLEGSLKNKSCSVVLRPEDGPWDSSEYSFFRVDLVNSGPGLIYIRGRLDNPGAEDWANSCSSSAVVLPGEKAVLGFAYPRANELNDAPPIFDKQSAKPNAHRTHWKQFDPSNVISCRLQIQSTADTINLEQVKVSMAQPYGVEANVALMELPYLDPFGQVRLLDWPGKLKSVEELEIRAETESKSLPGNEESMKFNLYGGWADGPRMEATGFFRTQKIDGKWWLIDPEGCLFFSHGANSIGYNQVTPLKDRKALFEWLPSAQDTEMSGVVENGKAHFIIANLIRTFGPDWKTPARERTHRRLRHWGINTIGAWSDIDLMEDRKTPSTPIIYTWGVLGDGSHGVADPFADYFKSGLQKAMRKLDASNPWHLGIFIDNELAWNSPFVHKAFSLGEKQPARQRLLQWLKDKYSDLEALNQAWETSYGSWDSIEALPPMKDATEAFTEDEVAMKVLIAEEYYRICMETMREELPNHLYLGSRIHTSPAEILHVAAKYVDVMSRNSYADTPAAGLVQGVDKPSMSTEFHFGSPDRGGLGVGLRPVGSQTQRARAYLTYVTSGLLHPNIVGTHWFAYTDQSAAGRPGENYQIGLIDVTGKPYQEFTDAVRTIGQNMYQIRYSGKKSLVETLESQINQSAE